MESEEKEKIHNLIDKKMKEILVSGLSREELLHGEGTVNSNI